MGMSVALQAFCGMYQIDGFIHYDGGWRRTDNSALLDEGLTLKESVDESQLYVSLRNSDSKDYVMTCAIVEFGAAEASSIMKKHSCRLAKPKDLRGAKERGLVSGHAYSLIKVLEVHGHKLVQLRNPWGRGEWNGDWSDNSPLWRQYPDVAETVGFEDAVDGSFYMSFPDFVKYFNWMDVCPKTMTSWNLPWSTAATVQRKRAVRKTVMCKRPCRKGKPGPLMQDLWSLCTCAKRKPTNARRRLAQDARRARRRM